MASKAKSRWADSEEDAALEAKLKREKEEKRRLKAEKARRLEEEKQAQAAAAAAAAAATTAAAEPDDDEDDDGRPAKRRKLTPDPEARNGTRNGPRADGRGARPSSGPASSSLLRVDGGGWGKCRSVEEFDKLNDIEEGTYGWVARARELATGKVVALKRLKIESGDRGGLPVTGLREIQVLRDCSHGNVVKMQEVVVGEDTSRIEK